MLFEYLAKKKQPKWLAYYYDEMNGWWVYFCSFLFTFLLCSVLYLIIMFDIKEALRPMLGMSIGISVLFGGFFTGIVFMRREENKIDKALSILEAKVKETNDLKILESLDEELTELCEKYKPTQRSGVQKIRTIIETKRPYLK